ncbi:hypothetical protein [Nocardia acidivorans]|uniref:hypothetical protein n=1 Tax=Nocardia acidivorans TaxID=404580 RepID=UPI0008348F37|nr:hypothetical protein [Nocardia acidivorans]
MQRGVGIGGSAWSPRSDYLSAIDELYAGVARELRELSDSVDWDDTDLSIDGRIAMEWGERFAAMNQEWARWALEQIPERRA